MAEVLGAKVGESIAVEEDLSVSEDWRGNDPSSNLTANSQAEAPAGQGESGEMLAPGSMPITIRVRVTFRLLNAAN